MQASVPSPTQVIERCAQVNRKVFCRHYNGCLDHAVKNDWQGFSCESCPSYVRQQFDSEEWNEDYARCMRLLFFMTVVDRKPLRHGCARIFINL